MIGVLLLVQWMVAAYACPVVALAQAAVGGSAAAQAGMPDCHATPRDAMDPANPLLCKAHCDADQQLPAHFALGEASAPALVWFAVDAGAALASACAPNHRPSVAHAGAPPGWPPLYLIHEVLRN